MSNEFPGSSAHPSPAHFPTAEKKLRKRHRSNGFAGLMRNVVSADKEGKRSVMPVVAAVILWGGLAYGGYAFANHTLEKNQQYIDQRIQSLEATNAKQVKTMEQQLASVTDEMKTVQDGLVAIKEELQLAGETIGGTNKTKQALNVRIDQLNKQLGELKASLKKLEDAARAW